MKLKPAWSLHNKTAAIAAVLSCLAGLFLLLSPVGDPLARLSFDASSLLPHAALTNRIVVVKMSEATYADPDLNGKYRYPHFDRSTHARFLYKLKADGALLVVFDIFFADTTPEDGLLATAITNHGNVVLAVNAESLHTPEFPGAHLNLTAPAFRDLPGCFFGLAEVPRDADMIVRRFPRGILDTPTLPAAAAAAVGNSSALEEPRSPRYVRYYPEDDALPSEPYEFAIQRPAGYFKDKIVFIGGKPKIDFVGAKSDEFGTALTRWTRRPMAGVEIHATMFLNLLNGHWLTRVTEAQEIEVILLVSLLCGFAFSRFGLLQSLASAGGAMVAMTALAIVMFLWKRVWFDWVSIAAVQIPAAWTTCALLHARELVFEKDRFRKKVETLESQLETLRTLQSLPAEQAGGAGAALLSEQEQPSCGREIKIPQYDLIKCIGEGAFGEVWLAWNVTSYRAIKLVFRKKFNSQTPYDREFEGLQNFEPVSRLHSGWVNILHVGREESAGFFYYAMELADDVATGRRINPESYTPKTLSQMLIDVPWLPVPECARIGAWLAEAVAVLHKVGLVHRDIKPSNVIFANGMPKLADIGLVAKVDGPKSFRGTIGFMPSTNLGTPSADVFALGRLLYQAATGAQSARYPSLPTSIQERTDGRDLMRLMEIIHKACSEGDEQMYSSAEELRDDLLDLESTLKRRRRRPRVGASKAKMDVEAEVGKL